ncbi:MAG: hypothetical protein GC162_16890 [Planctomycetes bacterium]|nr:hypothetical protein [Planctomycetota bacterium]
MKCAKRIVPLNAAAWLIVMVLMLGGCATPPSVPLLVEVAQKTIADERKHLDEDQARNSAWYEQERASLEAGYEADLAAHPQIDKDWVLAGTRVYVTAREALVEHEARSAEQIRTRARNLTLASEALDRALSVLQQREMLLWDAPQLRAWIAAQSSPNP